MKVSMAMPVTKQMGMIFLRIGASGMLDGSGFMLAYFLGFLLVTLSALFHPSQAGMMVLVWTTSLGDLQFNLQIWVTKARW